MTEPAEKESRELEVSRPNRVAELGRDQTRIGENARRLQQAIDDEDEEEIATDDHEHEEDEFADDEVDEYIPPVDRRGSDERRADLARRSRAQTRDRFGHFLPPGKR